MLSPKRTKFRRVQKGRNRGEAQRGSTIAFGSFGLKTLEPGWITSRQIEASRIAVTRYMKREGKVWIRIFPDKPITSKPAEVRMGKVKVLQATGSQLLDRDVLCLKRTVFLTKLLKKHFVWLHKNFQ